MRFIESLKEYPFTYFILVTAITTVIVLVSLYDFIKITLESENWTVISLLIFAILIYFGIHNEVWK